MIFVTGINPEGTEEEVLDAFLEFGSVPNPIKKLHLNLDRQSGYVKGYAIINFVKLEDAQAAINGKTPMLPLEMDGKEFMERTISVDWALKKPKGKFSRRR